MTVQLSLRELAHHLKITTDSDDAGVPPYYVSFLTRDLRAATELVERRAPLAPDAAQDMAVVLVCGYWFESPPAAPQRYGFNAWQHSGAAQLLAPWIERRAQAI